jgi:hypothetical protein
MEDRSPFDLIFSEGSEKSVLQKEPAAAPCETFRAGLMIVTHSVVITEGKEGELQLNVAFEL